MLRYFKDSVLEIELYLSGRIYREFDAKLISGPWPQERELMVLCDGGDPTRNRGIFRRGKVELTSDENARIVKLERV